MCNYDRNQVEVAYIYHVSKFYDTIENILKVYMWIPILLLEQNSYEEMFTLKSKNCITWWGKYFSEKW